MGKFIVSSFLTEVINNADNQERRRFIVMWQESCVAGRTGRREFQSLPDAT